MDAPSISAQSNLDGIPETSITDPHQDLASPSVPPPDLDDLLALLSGRFPLQDPDIIEAFTAGVRAGCELAIACSDGKSGETVGDGDLGILREKYEGILEGIRAEAYAKGVSDERAHQEAAHAAGLQPRTVDRASLARSAIKSESDALESGRNSHQRIKVEHQSELPLVASSSSSNTHSNAPLIGYPLAEDRKPTSLVSRIDKLPQNFNHLTLPQALRTPRSPFQDDIEAMAKTLADLDLAKYRLGHTVVDALDLVQTIVHLQHHRFQILSRQTASGHHHSLQAYIDQERAIRDATLESGIPFFEPGGRSSAQVIKVGERFAEEPSFLDPMVRDLWSWVGPPSLASI
ncbi:hypothetical protein NMY22_g12569 [Coprinellus aureogranulatus]|nr:hypothetical protein NMY22_g12569 [Coprinellus aureogranulatus]